MHSMVHKSQQSLQPSVTERKFYAKTIHVVRPSSSSGRNISQSGHHLNCSKVIIVRRFIWRTIAIYGRVTTKRKNQLILKVDFKQNVILHHEIEDGTTPVIGKIFIACQPRARRTLTLLCILQIIRNLFASQFTTRRPSTCNVHI